MTITLLQQDIAWAQPIANQQKAEKAMKEAPKSDLYVLPEMWSTGFATQPEGIAESNGESLRWMQMMADRLDAAVAGSIATYEDGCFFNRFYFVKPHSEGGEMAYYDKRHLFTYGGEHHTYSAGTARKIVEWRGVRFLLQVCYDLRFPVFSRNGIAADGQAEYDVALYVASWPVTRRAVWDVLLKARAIENQCYVCGINRIGHDTQCEYNGGTAVIDAYGRTVEVCKDGEASAITAQIDMERLRSFRKKFPVLNDRDA